MLNIVRTDATNSDFKKLVKKLDERLAITDGDDHAFYDQFNKIDSIKFVVMVYENETALGCGAIKKFDSERAEVKRMYVLPTHRGKGIATQILAELEKWAAELSFKKCILETGAKQVEALALYKKTGYQLSSNYGQYAGIENSFCFEKII